MADTLDRLKTALSDRYTIERELGSGGMATVYLAEDLKHHRKVAVKVLRPELAAALGAERFHREIEIAANLNHPHILPLLDSGTAEEPPSARPPDRPSAFLYYVMPYVEGESLRGKLAKEGELPIAEAVRILRDVVEALSHAHKHNVVHRDIKPDNVMLAERHALVTDFGVAKAVSEATGAQKLTTEGVALGTPAYMAPEQAAADPHIDHRADIYAVGVIAYELMTGRTPFVGNTQQELLAAHVTQVPDPVTKYRESVPPALAELVMKCLEKKAADRWQTAEELLPQLEALATPSGGVTPTGMVPVGAARRGWKLAAAAGAVAVLLAVVLVVTSIPRGSGVALDPERVLVAVFENQTGDPSLDPLGVMAGNWITQGLQKSGVVQVVPWLEAQQASRYVASEIHAGNVRSPVTALAEETGAGTVISGAYYVRGETVQYQVEATNVVRGQSLGALDPQSAPLESPDEAIEPLRQRVMGFLAVNLDERITAQANMAMQPPSFEAYGAFSDGLEQYFLRNWEGALPHFRRAFALDTSFVTVLRYAILTHINIGQYAQADSLIQVLERARDRLSEFERHWLDYMRAQVDRDPQAALQAIRRAAELAPGSKAVYNWALGANESNRPQEAVDALRSIDPYRGPMRGWPAYWLQLNLGLLTLGDYQDALEVGRQAFQQLPDMGPFVLQLQAQPLAALGRIQELNMVLDEVVTTSNVSGIRYTLVEAVRTLRVTGQVDAAQEIAERAIQWFEARPPDELTQNGHWYWYGTALHLAGRHDEALRVFDHLVEDNLRFEGLNARANRAFIAVEHGDTLQGLSDLEWFEDSAEDFSIERGIVAGVLGDVEQATELIRAGSRRYPGRVFNWFQRIRVLYEPLRDYPPFQELMRPKG